ncbi:MAG: 50S ribosomal protein L29 [Deltaproteobacteria bacterium]|nr:50S ribosomal protein L29 [Deltaproteobacteria bacterium]OQX60464.1 MAG: 50S ribosomal protein L29 [Desulfococcus sp. 4484_241]MCD6138486.1 50S ribosomal protein L29 [Deltaproteobacteria bacterium]RLB91735.1 MAG: 50S ribosomal protein L29 [Deltaproteobacteria bacterium]RLB96711.1 MAG: 50S ribosomal protein L29 [Deltaproteobacteria bacterium]
MKASEIRDLSLEEIRKKLEELNQEQFNLRFQHATDQLENPMRLRQVRKEIARMKTVLRERQPA